MAKTIILIEDEADLRAVIERLLTESGFEVRAAGSCAEGLRAIGDGEGDLMIVDLGLPDGSGLDLVAELRRRRPTAGIVVVTGKGDPIDRVIGLELGADDYVPKPFVGRELVARVRSVLRRLPPNGSGVNESVGNGSVGNGSVGNGVRRDTAAVRNATSFQAAGATINHAARLATLADGTVTVLSAAELAILNRLVAEPDTVVSRDDLSVAAWGRPWSPEDRTVDQNIASLRRKLGVKPGSHGGIITVRGGGYMYSEAR